MLHFPRSKQSATTNTAVEFSSGSPMFPEKLANQRNVCPTSSNPLAPRFRAAETPILIYFGNK